MTRDVQIMAEIGILAEIPGGLADEDRSARHCGEDRIRKRGDGAAGTTVGFKLSQTDIGDLQRAPALVDGEGDRHTLHRNHFADQFRKLRDRATLLAGPYLQQRLLLRIGSYVVDIKRGAEAALEHVSRDMEGGRDGAPCHVRPVDVALVDPPSLHGFACSVVGILADPTRTQYATVTYFQKPPFEMIGHRILPVFVRFTLSAELGCL